MASVNYSLIEFLSNEYFLMEIILTWDGLIINFNYLKILKCILRNRIWENFVELQKLLNPHLSNWEFCSDKCGDHLPFTIILAVVESGERKYKTCYVVDKYIPEVVYTRKEYYTNKSRPE